MVDKVKQREADIIACTSFVVWMKQAFANARDSKVKQNISVFADTFNRIIQSYEEELECLRAAQNVECTTPTASQPVPVESVEEQ